MTAAARYATIEKAAWEGKVGEVPRNVLAELPPVFAAFLNKADSKQYRLEFAAKLSKENLTEIIDLLRDNMRSIYEASGMGWNEKKKLRELADEEARFLLLRDGNGSLVGFAHFRFLVEDFCTVLYCYELQIRSDRARKGLGKRLMAVLEIIARKFEMEWVMLTVHLANSGASDFYRRIGYGIDETSPQMDVEVDGRDVPYEILSKKLRQ